MRKTTTFTRRIGPEPSPTVLLLCVTQSVFDDGDTILTFLSKLNSTPPTSSCTPLLLLLLLLLSASILLQAARSYLSVRENTRSCRRIIYRF